MIEEHNEETAALYALDLLEGSERSAFEAELSRDPALRALVDQLRESSAALALIAQGPAPSADLRQRLMASIGTPISGRSQATASTEKTVDENKVILFPLTAWLGWATAACFAAGMVYISAQYVAKRGEALASAERAELAEIQNKSYQQQLEASDIVYKSQVAALQRAADIAQLKIAKLVALAGPADHKTAVAIAVWNPVKQEGVLSIENLPALAGDEDYQLWVIDPQAPQKPVSSIVFAVDAKGAGRYQFHPDEPVSAAAVFAVSRERKGGSTTAKGPQGAIIATGEL